MHPSKRWYDAHEEFAIRLESLKTAKAGDRNRIVAGVLDIITADAPVLLEKYLLDFPLDQKRRRWYDRDPYLWLMVNGLEHAGVKLLRKVTVFMSKTKPKKKAPQPSRPKGKGKAAQGKKSKKK
jgi:hypothetical protein